MNPDSRRARRRAARDRMRARAIRVVREVWGRREGELDAWARQNADHLKVCSCFGCGNARRWAGPTPQERRAEDEARVEAGEVPATYHGVGKVRHYRPAWKPYGEISDRRHNGLVDRLEAFYREILGE